PGRGVRRGARARRGPASRPLPAALPQDGGRTDARRPQPRPPPDPRRRRMSGMGDVLAIARRSRGLTQADLAESTGLTQAALSRYESGLREPDGDVLDRLGRALGVTTRVLTEAGPGRRG